MKTWWYGGFLFIALALLAFIVFDLLFSPPTWHEGPIEELISVPAKTVATYTPHQGRKIGDHTITAVREEQWIAVVRHPQEGLVQVHCTKEHFEQLAVGMQLRFKKYEGKHFHIRYFAHYEDH